MNIIQLQPIFQKERGHGVSTFVAQMKIALESLGHSVERVFLDFSVEDPNTTITQDVINRINSADICFVHDLPNKKSNKTFNDAFIDLVANKIKIRKVTFFNMHKGSSLRMNHKAFLVPEFLKAFDCICSFTTKSEAMEVVEKFIGKEELEKRAVGMNQPCLILDSDKNGWYKHSDKWNAISYFGRYHPLKDVQRFLRAAKDFGNAGIELNIFGIDQTPSIIGVQDLKYHYDENGNRTKSTLVKWVTKTFLKTYGYDGQMCPYSVKFPKTPGIVYCFGPYRYENGMIAMKSTGFGCDFFNLENKQYGGNMEYAIYEMVKNGTIPLLDYGVGETMHFYEKDGSLSDKSILENEYGVFLKKDLSNLDEVIDKLKWIFSSETTYNSFRTTVFNGFKAHLMPQNSCGKLLNEILSR